MVFFLSETKSPLQNSTELVKGLSCEAPTLTEAPVVGGWLFHPQILCGTVDVGHRSRTLPTTRPSVPTWRRTQ